MSCIDLLSHLLMIINHFAHIILNLCCDCFGFSDFFNCGWSISIFLCLGSFCNNWLSFFLFLWIFNFNWFLGIFLFGKLFCYWYFWLLFSFICLFSSVKFFIGHGFNFIFSLFLDFFTTCWFFDSFLFHLFGYFNFFFSFSFSFLCFNSLFFCLGDFLGLRFFCFFWICDLCQLLFTALLFNKSFSLHLFFIFEHLQFLLGLSSWKFVLSLNSGNISFLRSSLCLCSFDILFGLGL